MEMMLESFSQICIALIVYNCAKLQLRLMLQKIYCLWNNYF